MLCLVLDWPGLLWEDEYFQKFEEKIFVTKAIIIIGPYTSYI